MTEENKHEAKIALFNGRKGNDYYLCSVRVSTALKSMEVMPAKRTGKTD